MSTRTARSPSIHSTSFRSETGTGAAPPIAFANRMTLRRFSLVSRMSRSMSCVVTGDPFNMLAELPMMTACSLAVRKALASATRVCSEMSEDVSSILPLGDEHRPSRRRQQERTHDQRKVTGIDLRKLRRQPRARLAHGARESVDVARPSSACAIAARCGAFRRTLFQSTLSAHLPGVHIPTITQALGFLQPTLGPGSDTRMHPARYGAVAVTTISRRDP